MSQVGDRATGSPADGARLALGTLTVLPTPPPAVVDRASAGWAMTLAPAVGLVLAVPCAGLVWLLGFGPNADRTFLWRLVAEVGLGRPQPPSPLVAAVLVVGLLALLTRGLHLDGLADTADGLGSGKPAAEALEVMRRGDIGPFGVVTLVLVLALQVAALAQLLAVGRGVPAVLLAVVVSRLVLPLVCLQGTPAARPDGLGAVVAGSVSMGQLLVAGALAVLSVTGFGTLVLLGAWRGPVLPDTASLVMAPTAALVGLAAGFLLARRCRHRLGGVTGDVLGASVEVTLTGVLLALTVL